MKFGFEHEDKITVFGIYQTCNAVEAAVEQLKITGFSNKDISVLMPEKHGIDKLSHAPSFTGEAVATGAGTGFVVGGTLGWLMGIGVLAIPGSGAFIAAGPIVSLLAGAGTGAALGGIAGGIVILGIPEYEAKRYARFIHEGGILVSVHADTSEEIKKAKTIFEISGATDIATTDELATAEYPPIFRPELEGPRF
ncbi:MAG: DUF3341 domain-containing protein [Pseudobdellovibrio sp.]